MIIGEQSTRKFKLDLGQRQMCKFGLFGYKKSWGKVVKRKKSQTSGVGAANTKHGTSNSLGRYLNNIVEY